MIAKLAAVGAVLAVCLSGGPGLVFGQDRVDSERAALEQFRRKELRKLERWGLEHLLRTERKVDREQKRRASTSSNPAELALLTEDEDSGVRFYVAANRHTPVDLLLQLSRDPVAYVRGGVAMSGPFDRSGRGEEQQLVEAMALGLATDPAPLVRHILAQNPNLTPAVFLVLARDTDHIIRQKTAQNVHATREALVALAQDSIVTVRATAAQHRNMPRAWLEQLSSDPEVELRLAVCRNINTPSRVLDALAEDPVVTVRQAAAEHPNTSLSTLQRLSADGAVEVVVAVAENPTADRTLLMELAFDQRDAAIRLAAHERLAPLLRNEIREDILERWD